jgi:hypothetical protein
MKLYIEDNETIPAAQVLQDSETTPVGYTDFSNDLLKWRDYGQSAAEDYLQYRNSVSKYFDVSLWGSMSNEEKYLIIKLDIYPDELEMSITDWNNLRGAFLATEGFDPTIKLLESFAEHHVLDVESCRSRAEDKQILLIVGKYISLPDASILFDLVQDLLHKYMIQGVKGENDGIVGVGLFDFFESTPGTIYEFTGLEAQGFDIKGTYTIEEFVTELMLWFRNGIRL